MEYDSQCSRPHFTPLGLKCGQKVKKSFRLHIKLNAEWFKSIMPYSLAMVRETYTLVELIEPVSKIK